MTVAWDVVESALEAWAVSVLGGDLNGSGQVVWRDRSKGVIRTPYLELAIENETPVGTPDVNYETIVVGGRSVVTPRVTGMIAFTLEARVRSREQTALKTARNHLEKLRSSLYHPPLIAPLVSAGVAFSRSHERLQTLKVENEGRVESVAILEVFFTVLSSLYLPDFHTDYVEAVDATVNGEPVVLP